MLKRKAEHTSEECKRPLERPIKRWTGHVVTLGTVTGEVYRGKPLEAEDNMNCQMAEVGVTFRDGRTHQLDNVLVRGNKIRFMILPDMLKKRPDVQKY
ncbi:Snf5- protein 1 [Parelaphostrongylus tenuis]|uniref:Small nuclear ribonucleoprotein Sm D3 n=1 Tax=Parelaphostrongylus tenuis TaxID=148309 RepID=A0AAD5QUR1_PARTN|nr:Snf5- protein 1 [Parelaphostrongylus tenuis]